MKGMVRKRPDGRWEGRVELPPDAEGKRRKKYVYANKRSECQRKVNDLVYQLECSDFADAGQLTVDNYLKEWFEVYKDKLADTTRLNYKNYIYKHLVPYFQGVKLKNLKPILIDAFYNHERKRYKEKTILQIHRIFSRALKDAVRNSLLKSNPCQLVDAPSPDEFTPNIPDVHAYYDILEAAKGTEHELPVMLAGLCGLRRGEVFGLTWNDIDFEKQTLTVRQVVCEVGPDLVLSPPKTKKSSRTIGVPEDLMTVLDNKKSVGFVCSRDGKPTHISNYSLRFKSFLKRNKLPHIRFHDLRHFHATLMLQAGLDIKIVQDRLGHSNINMTAHYQHILPETDKATVKKIDGYLRWSKGWSEPNGEQKS